jgi:hypothetical protein
MGWSGRERRKKKRYGLRDSLVRYKRGGLFSPFRGLSPSYLLLNFSKTGCHFISKEDPGPETALDLRVEVPGRGALGAKGFVAWSRKSDRLDAYRIGVRFTRVTGRSRILLQKLLDSALLENIDITTKVYLKEIEKL